MKTIKWNEEKNKLLQKIRNISFEEIEVAIARGNFWHIEEQHFNPEKYPNQKILFIEINNKIRVVPFIENEEEIFLKTMYESDKYTKIFLGNKFP